MATSRYTKPALRAKIVERVKAGSKGGKPGQWSARKAQLVASEYKKAGGGYRGGKSASQSSLKKWTGEKWTTRDGKPAKRKTKSGQTVMARYLPESAWKAMTPAQRKATDAKKRAGSKKGSQFVSNTKKAKAAGKKARK